MQNKQQNFNLVLLTTFLSATATAALAGGAVTGPRPLQPLLNDGGPGPCDPEVAGPDMVAGVDVGGHPVTPAGPQAHVPVPDQILVPLKRGGRHRPTSDGPIVALDGRALDPLLNPLRACPPGKR